MTQWNLIVDVTKCSNCNNCTMAMKDEYVGNDFPGYCAPQPRQGHDWIVIDRHVRGNGTMVDVNYVPRTCNHCADAPCVKAGGGAVVQRADGIVMIDPGKAKGRRDLVDACPYGAIAWNEELQLPQQWIFDAHLLDAGWKVPRIVQACATGALEAVKVDDAAMQARARAEGLDVLRPELGTRPRVYYRGLERIRTAFVGGNLFGHDSTGQAENVEGAEVTLSLSGDTSLRRERTDVYGDFKFDGLPGASQAFTVRATHPGFGSVEVAGTLDRSLNLGSLQLK